MVLDCVGERCLRCRAHAGRVLVVRFAGRDRDGMEGLRSNKVFAEASAGYQGRRGRETKTDKRQRYGESG
jgi:hypothetical protein